MIDIHCHILYDLDDGAEDINMSVEMAKLAEKNGTAGIIATPHSNVPDFYDNYWSAEISDRISVLNSRLSEEGLKLRIFPGCEIFVAGDFLKLLKSGKLITLNNSIYPLVEFDFYEHPTSVFMKLQQIISEGFIPIVAHPERYAFVNEDESAIKRLKTMGCLLQVNKGSLKGSFGIDAQVSAHEILSKECADFIASDAHSPYRRTPYLADSYETVSELYSKDYAEQIFNINPQLVLNNKKI